MQGKRVGVLKDDGQYHVDIDGTDYLEQDIIWAMAYNRSPKSELIHIDGDKTNNTITNLKES